MFSWLFIALAIPINSELERWITSGWVCCRIQLISFLASFEKFGSSPFIMERVICSIPLAEVVPEKDEAKRRMDGKLRIFSKKRGIFPLGKNFWAT